MHFEWEVKAKRLRSPEIDHQLRLGQLLEWKISGVRALQYLPDIEARYAKCVAIRRAIGS